MKETNVPDPWATKPEVNIDDGGGPSFSSGYDVNTLTLSGFQIQLPKTVGCWRISGDFHSKMTKLLLGWEWVDA